MRVQTAINMLRDHGCKAFVCADGLVAVYKAPTIEVSADDKPEAYATFEVSTLVAVYSQGDRVWEQHDASCPTVDGDAIRAFCAY